MYASEGGDGEGPSSELDVWSLILLTMSDFGEVVS